MTETIKICKKHGNLKKEETSISKGKYLLCKHCIKLNREKTRIKNKKIGPLLRKKLLKEKHLTKTCKNHGELSRENISVNIRGNLYCLLCGKEQSKKNRYKDIEKHRETVRKWLNNNPDKRKLYEKNDRENKRKRQKRRYRRRVAIPETHEHMLKVALKSRIKHRASTRQKQLIRQRKQRKELEDPYVKKVICLRTSLKSKDIPLSIVDLFRKNLKIKRKLREREKIKNEIQENKKSG